jgi:outer membrane protein assembly factor BamD (BamD/ComL family)
MKRFLIFISIIVLLIAFYAIVSMLRSSALEKQRQQEAIRLENNYQEGIKQISEGKFGDAMTSLSHAALSNYKHARLLYPLEPRVASPSDSVIRQPAPRGSARR